MAAELRKKLLLQYGMPPPEALRPPVPVFPADSPNNPGQGGQNASRGAPGGQALSPLGWELYFDERREVAVNETDTFAVYTAGNGPATFVLLHGGGHTSMSWACCAAYLKRAYRVVAIDFRKHGATRTADENDVSIGTLQNDVLQVLQKVCTDPETGRLQPIVLVGHSLGGAVATFLAHSRKIPVTGLIVVDVVEGSALDALKNMPAIVRSRPKGFRSLDGAIMWHLQSGAIKNLESARVSVPPQLVQDPQSGAWLWRTDLMSTQPYWRGWFEGMSEAFLKAPTAKLVILAGPDRLDRQLTIAHMQGKFQLEVLAAVGHTVQEDKPRACAELLLGFARRYRFGEVIPGIDNSGVQPESEIIVCRPVASRGGAVTAERGRLVPRWKAAAAAEQGGDGQEQQGQQGHNNPHNEHQRHDNNNQHSNHQNEQQQHNGQHNDGNNQHNERKEQDGSSSSPEHAQAPGAQQPRQEE